MIFSKFCYNRFVICPTNVFRCASFSSTTCVCCGVNFRTAAITFISVVLFELTLFVKYWKKLNRYKILYLNLHPDGQFWRYDGRVIMNSWPGHLLLTKSMANYLNIKKTKKLRILPETWCFSNTRIRCLPKCLQNVEVKPGKYEKNS